MAVIARPDITGALIARIRSITEITALASTRISAELQDAWDPMPRHAVRIRQTGGPPPDINVNILRSRFDVWCYGSTGREASRLLDIVIPALCPDQSQRSGFAQGSVKVYDVQPEAGPISGRTEENWPYCWQPVIVTFSGVPLS